MKKKKTSNRTGKYILATNYNEWYKKTSTDLFPTVVNKAILVTVVNILSGLSYDKKNITLIIYGYDI